MNNSNVVIGAENNDAEFPSNNTVNKTSSNDAEIAKLKKLLVDFTEKLNKGSYANTKEQNILKGYYINTIIDCFQYIHINYEKNSLFFPSYATFKEIFEHDKLDSIKEVEFTKACLRIFSSYKPIHISNTNIIIAIIYLSNIYTNIDKLRYLINTTSNDNSAQENNFNNNIYHKAKSINKEIKYAISNYKENITWLKKLNALLLDSIVVLKADNLINYAKEVPDIIEHNQHQINKNTYAKLQALIKNRKTLSEDSFKEIKKVLESEGKVISDNLDYLESYKKYFDSIHREILQSFNEKYGISIEKNNNRNEHHLQTAIQSLEKYYKNQLKHLLISAIISLAHLFINQRVNAMNALRKNISDDKFCTLLPIIEATYEVMTGDLSIVSIDNKTINQIIKLKDKKIHDSLLAKSSLTALQDLIQKLNNNITDLRNSNCKDSDKLKKDSIDIVLNIYIKNNKNIYNTQKIIHDNIRLYLNDIKFFQLIFMKLSTYSIEPNEKLKQIILQEDEYHNLKIDLRKAYLSKSDDECNKINIKIFQLIQKYPYGELQSTTISTDLQEITEEFCENSDFFTRSQNNEPYALYLDEDDQKYSENSSSTSSLSSLESIDKTETTRNLHPLSFSNKCSSISISHSKNDKKKKISLPPLSINLLKADTPIPTNSHSDLKNTKCFKLDDCDDDDYKQDHINIRKSTRSPLCILR